MRRALLAYSDSSCARMPVTGSLNASATPAFVSPKPRSAKKMENRQRVLKNRPSIRALPILRNCVALHFVDQALAAEAQDSRCLQLVVARANERLGDHAALHLLDRFFQRGLRRPGYGGLIAAGRGDGVPQIVLDDQVSR